jgi:hypothetical protein
MLTMLPQPTPALVAWACRLPQLHVPADRPWWMAPAPAAPKPGQVDGCERQCACLREWVWLPAWPCEDKEGMLYLGQCSRIGCQSILWAYRAFQPSFQGRLSCSF